MSFAKNEYQQLTLNDNTFSLTARELRMLERSLAKQFAEKIFPLINEEKFSVLYSDKASRPNTPVNIIIGGMEHYYDPGDYNMVIYHSRSEEAGERI